MREIQATTNWEKKSPGSVGGGQVVSSHRINELHAQAEMWRDKTVADAGQACRCAIECGGLLLKVRESHRGEFLSWLEMNCPTISNRTAYNYMAIAIKYVQVLANGHLDFKTLKDLYIATGIMPAPESPTDAATKEPLPAWMRWTEKLDGLIEKLKADEKERLRAWCQLVLQRL